jgi:hypothetical protein
MKIGNSHLPPVTPASTKAAKTTGAGEQKTVPPGLERVQARLQSVPAADRNAGQATASDRISRNIARYAETQAIVALPVTAPVTPPALPTTPTESTSTAPTDSTTETSTPTPEAGNSTTVETTTSNGDTPTA